MLLLQAASGCLACVNFLDWQGRRFALAPPDGQALFPSQSGPSLQTHRAPPGGYAARRASNYAPLNQDFLYNAPGGYEIKEGNVSGSAACLHDPPALLGHA